MNLKNQILLSLIAASLQGERQVTPIYGDTVDAVSPPITRKRRAGYTTNKGKGQSKAKRRMASDSRRRNRAQ